MNQYNPGDQKERARIMREDALLRQANLHPSQRPPEPTTYSAIANRSRADDLPKPSLEVPRLPSNSPWSGDPTGPEPPLGIAIDDMELTGTPAEIAKEPSGAGVMLDILDDGLAPAAPTQWSTPTLVDSAVAELKSRWAWGLVRLSDLPEYKAWLDHVQRCENPRSKGYPDYGGRGIIVCERWKASFWDFLEDAGLKPSPELSLDRRDNDGNYEPSNCRWATAYEQTNNRRPFDQCGEKGPNAKLKADDVREIKALLREGRMTHREIGDRFGVTNQCINLINRGHRWSHIQDEGEKRHDRRR